MAVKRTLLEIAAPLILILAAFAIYAGAIQHPRILDEDELIWGNPAVNGQSAAAMLEGRWQAGDFRPQARPVATIFRAGEHAVHDFERGKYQIDQIVLHGIAAFLLYLLLRRWLKSRVGGFLGAILFAAHPAASHSVLYLGGLSEILATIFGLLCLLFMRPDSEPTRRRLVAVGAAAFLGILSKEVGVLIPVVAGAVLLSSGSPKNVRRAYGIALGAGLLAALAYRTGALAAVPEMQSRIPAIDPASAVPFYPLILQSIAGIAVETGVLLAPTRLSIDYSWLMTLHGAPLIALAAAGLLILAGGGWMILRNATPVRTGLALLCLLPMLAAGLLPGLSGVVAGERILYPALAGWCGLLVLLGQWIWALRAAAGPILAGFAVGVAALLGIRSVLRVPDFADDRKILASALESYAGNPQILYSMGNSRLAMQDYKGARTYYEGALKLRPDFPICSANLATTYLGEESYGLALRILDPVAVRVKHVRALRQVDAKVHYHAGLVLMNQARYKEAAEAFERTLLFYPNHTGALGNLGLIYIKSPPYSERGIRLLKTVISREGDETRRALLQKGLTMAEELLRDYVRERGDVPSKLEPEDKGLLGEPWKDAADEGM
jgi:tetratricopeptide (TPR) repeat protein